MERIADQNQTQERTTAAVFSNASSKDTNIAALTKKVEQLEQGRNERAERYETVRKQQHTQARKLISIDEASAAQQVSIQGQARTIGDMQARIQELEAIKHALTSKVVREMETNVALASQVDKMYSDAQAQDKRIAKLEAQITSNKAATDDVLNNVLEITWMFKHT
jgi:chromosome segregation ATPase